MCKRSWIKYALSAINIHFKVLHTKFFHIYYIFLLDTLNVIVSFLPVRKHEAERTYVVFLKSIKNKCYLNE